MREPFLHSQAHALKNQNLALDNPVSITRAAVVTANSSITAKEEGWEEKASEGVWGGEGGSKAVSESSLFPLAF